MRTNLESIRYEPEQIDRIIHHQKIFISLVKQCRNDNTETWNYWVANGFQRKDKKEIFRVQQKTLGILKDIEKRLQRGLSVILETKKNIKNHHNFIVHDYIHTSGKDALYCGHEPYFKDTVFLSVLLKHQYKANIYDS